MKLTEYDPMRHHSIEYPMEVGAPKFELVPVQNQKDVMRNVARLHAQQEYDRIMEVVRVMQQQAESIKRRIDVTDWVCDAYYQFKPVHGNIYWLAHDHHHKRKILLLTGPQGWSSSAPKQYQYICAVKYLGDYTWMEVE